MMIFFQEKFRDVIEMIDKGFNGGSDATNDDSGIGASSDAATQDSDALTQDSDVSMPNVSPNDGVTSNDGVTDTNVTDNDVTDPGSKVALSGDGTKEQHRVDENATPTELLSVDAT